MIVEGKNWGEFKKNKCKLGNKCNKLFIRQQKTLEEKAKNKYKNLKVSTLRLMTLKVYRKKRFKNEKSIFKQFIISKDEMDEFEKGESRKEIKISKKIVALIG